MAYSKRKARQKDRQRRQEAQNRNTQDVVASTSRAQRLIEPTVFPSLSSVTVQDNIPPVDNSVQPLDIPTPVAGTSTARDSPPNKLRGIVKDSLPCVAMSLPDSPPAVSLPPPQGKGKRLRGVALNSFLRRRLALSDEQSLPSAPSQVENLLQDFHITDASSHSLPLANAEPIMGDVVYGRQEQIDYDSIVVDTEETDIPATQTGIECTTLRCQIIVDRQTQRCAIKHRGLGCGAISVHHYPDYYHSGNYGDKVCTHCSALLLNSENSQVCCSQAQVSLPPLSPFPPELKELMVGDNCVKPFIRKQLHYNTLMQFASVSAGRGPGVPGRGPQPIILNGEFDRRISGLNAPTGRAPAFAQLYILNPEDALDNRAQNPLFADQSLNEEILRILDTVIRREHPLARAYNSFHEYIEEHTTHGGPIPQYRMVLLNEWEAPTNIHDPTVHSRQVNLPHQGEGMFMIWDASTDLAPPQRGVWISSRDGYLTHLDKFHPSTDGACYPLLFPKGDAGFRLGIKLNKTTPLQPDADEDCTLAPQGRKFVSLRQYYKHRLAIRANEFNPVWASGGGLGQKFILDLSARVDHQVAENIRKAQAKCNLRSALPEAMLRFLQRGLRDGERLGRVVLFNAKVPGTRPYFRRAFNDAATIMQHVRREGCATFLLTFTSNPNWPEVKNLLFANGQLVIDRPDALVRVYQDKVKVLHRELDKSNGILGNILGYAESMEFQKRGGPHLHRVMATDVPNSAAGIDEYICAEIPQIPPTDDNSEGADKQRLLRQLVLKHQLHTCRPELCLAGGRGCSKGFPKPFSKRTILYDDRHAIFKRRSPRDGGERAIVRVHNSERIYTNASVVPYNPYLLLKYQTHHNLEYIYGETSSMKYALKYPFKGASLTYVRNEKVSSNVVDYDEPAEYAKCVFRSASEAYARLIGMKYVLKSHAVYDLSVHLPEQQRVVFREGQESDAAERFQEGVRRKTPLLAYFDAAAKYPQVKTLLFRDMPLHFTYVKGEWRPRTRDCKTLGYVYPVSPSNIELFSLYTLLMHTPAASYEELRTVDGHTYDTFAEAARVRGLLRDDNLWNRTLTEGATRLNPREMRQLFVSILLYGFISDPLALWTSFVHHMYDTRGITCDAERQKRIDKALQLISNKLQDQGRSLASYSLPVPHGDIEDDLQQRLERFYFSTFVEDEHDETENTNCSKDFYNSLNNGQKAIIDSLEKALSADANDKSVPRLFFLTGDGGTGKTFVYNTAIHRFRQMGKRVLSTASTGIAATLLFSGTTFHSAFRMGISIDANTPCPHDSGSYFGKRISQADMIILDEAPMLNREVIECAEKWCRQLAPRRLQNLHFGGKVVLFGGDWKQLLPVVTGHGIQSQIDACFKRSLLFEHFCQVELTENMRLSPGEQDFCQMLKSIGNGSAGDTVHLPQQIVVRRLEELLEFVFQDKLTSTDPTDLLTRIILACRNEDVDAINKRILETLPGDEKTYLSSDRSKKDDPMAVNAREHEVDSLNNLSPPGLPKHKLALKEGSIIVLLKNINISLGLCNGTRLYVEELTETLIIAKAITGSSAGSGIKVAISKSVFEYKDDRPEGIHFERLQFPVRLAFAMTINKAQGQTLTRLGIDLTNEVFSHGQLYTAFSRVKTQDSLRVFAPNSHVGNDTQVANIVVQHIL